MVTGWVQVALQLLGQRSARGGGQRRMRPTASSVSWEWAHRTSDAQLLQPLKPLTQVLSWQTQQGRMALQTPLQRSEVGAPASGPLGPLSLPRVQPHSLRSCQLLKAPPVAPER